PRPAAPRPPLCMHCLGPDPDDGGLGRDLGVTTSPGPADGPRLVGADRLPSHVSVCGGRTGWTQRSTGHPQRAGPCAQRVTHTSRRSVRHIPQRRSAAMILTTLNHEWARLVETTDVTVWAASCSALANANDLDMVLAATKGDDPDRVLRFLISQHQAG